MIAEEDRIEMLNKARLAYIHYTDHVHLVAEENGISFFEAEEIVTERKLFRAVFAQDWNKGRPNGPKVYTSLHLSTGDREEYIRRNQHRINHSVGRKWYLCVGPKIYGMIVNGEMGELFDAQDVEDGMEEA